jgi:hypothetical protein
VPIGGATIYLSSSSTYLTTQPSVVVPSGATSTSVVVNTSSPPSTQSATLTATAGPSTRTATVSITSVPVSVSNLVCTPSSGKGGSFTPVCTITLNRQSATSTTVTLTSGNTNAATVPASISIFSGLVTKQFNVTTKVVAANTTAVISAKVGTTTAKTVTITVTR